MITDRRSELIDLATNLVRGRGFSAFSYADLSEAAGIRKPSIHHHFPTKEDLGVELVAAYTERFSVHLDTIDARGDGAAERLAAYVTIYRDGVAAGQGCLCGVLASELGALPVRLQAGVRKFFSLNLRWLEKTLRDGVEADLGREVEPVRDAHTVLSTLQGAMFVALSLQSPAVFDQAVDGLLRKLVAGR